jgi:biopolymer transport protein ExbD
MAFRIRRGTTMPAQIPTATMADIAFLLLIFFLTTTIFRLEEGLPLALPLAETGERTTRQSAVHVWIDRSGRILVADREVDIAELGGLVRVRTKGEPVAVSLQIDRALPCGTVHRALEELKRANLLNVSFGTEAEAGPPWRVGGGRKDLGTGGGSRP